MRLAKRTYNPGIEEILQQGRQSARKDRNPYDRNRKTQRVKFYAWQAGHCDKWGQL